MKSKVLYDKQSDSVYITLRSGREDHFEEVEPGFIVEYNKNDQPIGIEILNAKSTLIDKIGLSFVDSKMNGKNTVYKTSSK